MEIIASIASWVLGAWFGVSLLLLAFLMIDKPNDTWRNLLTWCSGWPLWFWFFLTPNRSE